ncbi:hypothetical protein RRG08_052511 [Elysia crispata]|uniref:Uncharacterized protein n=1 Tax=Elysia crispata TaxID=231223 RepID=A0AAE1DG21_9GAST|nr:hypothetical protein RRG08_052511 [Elysia crispata]
MFTDPPQAHNSHPSEIPIEAGRQTDTVAALSRWDGRSEATHIGGTEEALTSESYFLHEIADKYRLRVDCFSGNDIDNAQNIRDEKIRRCPAQLPDDNCAPWTSRMTDIISSPIFQTWTPSCVILSIYH